MRITYYAMALMMLGIFGMTAQESFGPVDYGEIDLIMTVPSLSSRANLIPGEDSIGEAKDRRSIRASVIIGKNPQTEDDFFYANPNPAAQSRAALPPDLVFDAYSSGSQPTDPAIAVGPNHVFAVWNTAFRIYDKDGNALTGVLSVNNIFSPGGCCDLTVSYDQQADRWVLSYLFSSNGQVQVAISTGPDPVNEDWNVYSVPTVRDYNKLSVAPNGYYITANTTPRRTWALNRDEMVLGNTTAAFQIFNIPQFISGPIFNCPQIGNVSDSNMPDGPATLVHMADNAWSGAVADDQVRVWTVDVDFETPANSSISTPDIILLQDFNATFDGGGFSNLDQPNGGADLDALQNTIMNQAQIRKFDTHNSMIFNFVVDVDATAAKKAGIRWVELRQADDTAPWTLYQEGTYTAPDEKHAWCGSMIMDSEGNIAMGYTGMSTPASATTVNASSFYTGRLDGDPLGTMTVAEEEIRLGSGSVPGGGGRYGDYAKMDIDPNNDLDFWFITELNSGGRKGVVGKFTFTPPGSRNISDIGVIDIVSPRETDPLSTATDIEVQIHNFGTEAVTDPELQYTVDGGTPVVENYSGTIQPGETVTYTFGTTANMLLSNPFLLTAQSNLGGDDAGTNDDTARRYDASLGVDDPLESADFVITSLPNRIYELSMNTSFDKVLDLSVFNANGQQVLFTNIDKEGSTYRYRIDMSFAADGVYILQLGDKASGIFQTGKIIVK